MCVGDVFAGRRSTVSLHFASQLVVSPRRARSSFASTLLSSRNDYLQSSRNRTMYRRRPRASLYEQQQRRRRGACVRACARECVCTAIHGQHNSGGSGQRRRTSGYRVCRLSRLSFHTVCFCVLYVCFLLY